MSLRTKKYLFALWIFISICLFAYGRTLQAEECTGTCADTFYQYTDDHGVLSLTDDPERIPERYYEPVNRVLVRSWEILRATTRPQWTPHSTNHPVSKWDPVSSPERNPNRERKCTGHTTITTKRVQDGEYNREVYVVTNRCGRVVSVTPYPPEMTIRR